MANVAELQLQIRRGTASAWTTADPTLLAGEWGYETDTNLLKIGDGSTVWTSLPYWGTFQDIFTRAPETGDPTAGDSITTVIGFNSYDGNQFGYLGYGGDGGGAGDFLELVNKVYDADVNIFATDGTSGTSDYGLTFNSQAWQVNLDVNGSPETMYDIDSSGSTTVADCRFYVFIPVIFDFHLSIESDNPYVRWFEQDVPLDQKDWRIDVNAETLNHIIYDDAGTNSYLWLEADRSGTGAGVQVDNINFYVENSLAINVGGVSKLDIQSALIAAQTELEAQQAFRAAITSTAAATLTLDATHYTVIGSLAGNQTFTLPTAVGVDGRIYNIKKTGASGTLTVDTTSSQTIDGSLTAVLTVQYENLTVQSDGANWIIL